MFTLKHLAAKDDAPFSLMDGESIVWYDYDYESQMWHFGILAPWEEPGEE